MDLKQRWTEIKESRSFEEFYFIAIALILAFGSLQTAGTALNTDKPVVSVVSCSMYPELHVGDILFVQGKEFSDIREGDIAVYDVREIRISVNDQTFKLNKYSKNEDSVETEAGNIKFISLVGDRRTSSAKLRVDGETVVMNEGQVASVNGYRVGLREVKGMNIPIVHRVIEKNPNSIETQGDNNPSQLQFESSVRPEQIQGTYMFKIPRIGGLKLLAMDILGFSGDRPLVIDLYPSCDIQVPLDQRPY